jgi:hypothetical protein
VLVVPSPNELQHHNVFGLNESLSAGKVSPCPSAPSSAASTVYAPSWFDSGFSTPTSCSSITSAMPPTPGLPPRGAVFGADEDLADAYIAFVLYCSGIGGHPHPGGVSELRRSVMSVPRSGDKIFSVCRLSELVQRHTAGAFPWENAQCPRSLPPLTSTFRLLCRRDEDMDRGVQGSGCRTDRRAEPAAYPAVQCPTQGVLK